MLEDWSKTLVPVGFFFPASKLEDEGIQPEPFILKYTIICFIRFGL